MKQDEKKCPRCGEGIKVDASVCRHCGHEFTQEEVAASIAEKKAATRKGLLGCLGCGGIIAVVAIIAAIGAGSSESDGNETAAQQLEATANTLDAAADKVAGNKPDAKQAFVDQYREMLQVAKPCDEALSGLGGAADRAKASGDLIQLMAATSAGQNACAAAAGAIRSMTPPAGLPDKAKDLTSKALKSCFRGYDRREQAFTRANNIVAGEGGDIQDAVQDIERSRSDIVTCVVGYVAAASEAGVDADRMK